MIPQDWPPSMPPVTVNPPPGSAAIVLPVRDNLRFVKLTLHSILDFTNTRYMLTLVDNMSGFKTREFLTSARSNHPINVIQYQGSRSLSAIWNAGLRFMFSYANVAYGVVTTPSIVVTPGWLWRMIRLLNENPKHGVLNPHSNAANHDQDLLGRPIDTVWPFCAMFTRALYERIGGFDETYTEPGPCIQDFAERASRAGFPAFCADVAYVHVFWRFGWEFDPAALACDAERLLRTYDKAAVR